MGKLITIGEARINFIPIEIGVDLKEVSGFFKSLRLSPANVVSCVGIDMHLLYKYDMCQLGENELKGIITFVNTTRALVLRKKGSLAVMQTLEQVLAFK